MAKSNGPFQGLPSIGGGGVVPQTALVGNVSPPFSLDDLTNVILNMDASDAATYTTSGSNMSTWTDKSSNAYVWTAQPSSGRYPLLATADQNGLNAIDFGTPGTARGYFSGPAGTPTLADPAQPLSIYLVCKMNGSGNYPTAFSLRSSASKALVAMDNVGNGGRMHFGGHTTSGVWTNFYIPTTNNTAKLYTWIYNGSGGTTLSNFSAYLNSVLQTKTSEGQGDVGSVNNLGGQSGGNYPFSGKFYQLLVCREAHNAATQADVEALLTAKWGI
jgi:hypothetical protein